MNAALPSSPIVLSIAGADTSAGAGIQADLKTLTACGCYAMTAITALTAQGPDGVRACWPVGPEQLRQQIQAALAYQPAALKTGMLGNAALIQVIVTLVAERPPMPLVVDPVILSSSGATLLDDAGTVCLREQLLPLASVVTPNRQEAEQLFGTHWRDAISAWTQQHKTAILVTGGDGDDANLVTDLLFIAGECRTLQSPRIHTRNHHGTGCTLASAIAAGLAQQQTVITAIERARHYVHSALLAAQAQPWPGRGPLQHFFTPEFQPNEPHIAMRQEPV